MLNKIKSFKKPNKISKEIIINIEPLETRVAILENKNLDNFLLERKKIIELLEVFLKEKYKILKMVYKLHLLILV